MKILHTSDWHLGHQLYGRDRLVEHTAMLRQMVSIVEAERPDVFVLSGDIFHSSQPSSSVQTQFTNAIVALRAACRSMSIVMIAGNHDSDARTEIFHEPWRLLNVHSIGSIERVDLERHIIEIPHVGFVVAVPYAYERSIPDGFFPRLLEAVAERNAAGLPVVMVAHTTVLGCDFTGHENASERTVGGIDAYDLSVFGSGYDYLALGHIHHAQFIHGSDRRARYSGTPVAVSFDEAYEHSVTVVTIERHGDEPRVRTIAIENCRPLVTLPSAGETVTWDEAKALLADYPNDIPAYLRLNVEVDGFLPAGAREEAESLIKDKQCALLHINAKRPEATRNSGSALTVDELKTIAPVDLVRRYAAGKGISFTEDMEAIFKQAVDAVNEEGRES